MIITCKKGAPQNEVEKIVKGFERKDWKSTRFLERITTCLESLEIRQL